jgi:biopolymer transport protein ExbB
MVGAKSTIGGHMLDLFIKGGPVLWFLILLSLIAAAVIIERLLYFRRIKSDETKLFNRVKSSLQKGFFEEALSICDSNLSPLGALLRVGIEHRNESDEGLREIMKDSANQEIPRLERYVSSLDTIAHIGPLCGLLGTVTGTMKAFGVLGTFGAVSDPTLLAKGISEALIATVAGIIVAVPSVVFYNYFVVKINRILITLEYQVNELVLMIRSGKGARTGGAS